MANYIMHKADSIFYDLIEEILDQENSTTKTFGGVRPVLKSSGDSAHSVLITDVFEKYDLSKGEFPIIHARPISVMAGIKEILWIYQDQTNELSVLKEKYNVHWWDDWNVGDDTIGKRYGYVVNKYGFIDELIRKLKTTPNDRRMYFDLNQRTELKEPAKLDACAFMTVWNVRQSEYLDMCLTIRSNDYLVAGHINRMQYVALQMMIAQVTGFKVGTFSVVTNNLHIYENQFDHLQTILNRKEYVANLTKKLWVTEEYPKLTIDPSVTDFYDFRIDHFKMENYSPLEKIDAFELAI